MGIATPTITGLGEPGATVTVVIDGATVGTAVVGPDGSWTVALIEPLADGDHTVTATQTDAAANVSADLPIVNRASVRSPDAFAADDLSRVQIRSIAPRFTG